MTAKTRMNARYSGRANAVRPRSTPGTAQVQRGRPGSPAQKKLSTAPLSVSVASGSLISLPVNQIVTGYSANSAAPTRPAIGPASRRPIRNTSTIVSAPSSATTSRTAPGWTPPVA